MTIYRVPNDNKEQLKEKGGKQYSQTVSCSVAALNKGHFWAVSAKNYMGAASWPAATTSSGSGRGRCGGEEMH